MTIIQLLDDILDELLDKQCLCPTGSIFEYARVANCTLD